MERRFNQRLDPVVHRPPEREAGDGDPDLRRRQVEIETIERLARQLGGPVALLGELVDLGRPHLDQGELDRDEKTIDQDQTRDQQDLDVSHIGSDPVLYEVKEAEVEGKIRHTQPVRSSSTHRWQSETSKHADSNRNRSGSHSRIRALARITRHRTKFHLKTPDS